MQSSVPCSRTLFEAIEGSMELTNEMFSTGFHESRGLNHINILLEDAIKERCKYI